MEVEIFNPRNKPVSELPIIYGFNEGLLQNEIYGPVYHGRLIHSDGYSCGTHICSNEEWMKTDLGIKKGSAPYRHEELRKMSPHGYVMEFVSLHDVPTHAALQAAISKARK